MRRFTKIPILLILLGVTFYSCQKEEIAQESETVNEDYLTPMPETIDEGEFDIIAQPENYSTSNLYGSEFKDGGMAMIAGQFLTTAVIGNQRWTTIDFKGYLNDPTLTDIENTIFGDATDLNSTRYYSHKLAMTINESPTMLNYNAPDGLVELSNWRIPSRQDINNLGFMVGPKPERYVTISDKLQFKKTGMIYHQRTSPYDPNALRVVHQRPDELVFWNAKYIPYDGSGSGPNGTWHLTGGNAVDYIYLFQYQLLHPHAPIRLVQDIEPIQ